MGNEVKPQGVLLVVSGPSGAGKGTICGMLREQLPELGYSVSVTTRQPRTGEVDGVNYFFKTVDEVKEMIAKDELLEYAEVYGNYYGTPRQYVMDQLNAGKEVLLWTNCAHAFINAVLIAKRLSSVVWHLLLTN